MIQEVQEYFTNYIVNDSLGIIANAKTKMINFAMGIAEPCTCRKIDMGKTVKIHGFPTNVSAEKVKNFLEDCTGNGTVHALKVKQSQAVVRNPRAFAIVQCCDIA
ncbi:hypothetical protein IFM89_020840 [Coptis chinensis]|uniref:RDR1/2-like RRM domain-containing protein n=1 Tax=Coptis chinensis TaxID=261450 RepID=A0A835MFJ0_9MAGN|nr:hypothetical protein IFM89_020840 [Coptis chinensis]